MIQIEVADDHNLLGHEPQDEEEENAPFAINNNFNINEEASSFNRKTDILHNSNSDSKKGEQKKTENNLKIDNIQVEELMSSSEMMLDSIIAAANEAVLLEEGEQQHHHHKKKHYRQDDDFSQLMREADNTVRTSSTLSGSDTSIDTDVASNCNNRVAKAKIISADSFSAEVFIPQTTLRSAMSAMSNPDLLRVWCYSVINVFVTKESGQYDGEWIEGAATLRTPPGYNVFNLFSSIKTYLGFSSHGKISLFIERKKGKLTLTLGPLADASIIIHAFTFVQKDRGVVVTDIVSVQRNVRLCWSSIPLLNRYFCSTIKSHMDQALVSMEDMKILMEHGETAVESIGSFDNTGVTPLLGGPAL